MADNNPEVLHVIDVPLAFYEWLATVEKDGRVHDLMPHEIAGLQTALCAPAVSEEAVERVSAAIEDLIPWSPGTESRRGFPSTDAIARAAIDALFPTIPTEEPQS